MKPTLLASLATSLLAAGAAQAQITITQSNFPATTATVERGQAVSISGVAVPATGANQTWNYGGLAVTGSVQQSSYITPPANAAFAGATRAYTYSVAFGPSNVNGTAYQALNANGLQDLGFAIQLQRFGLGSFTGNPSDSLIVPTQQQVYSNVYRVKFPLTAGSVQRNNYRTVSRGILTVSLLGYNRAPVQLVQRVTQSDSVAGWGTLRVPVASGSGATAPIPVLMRRTRVRQVDSVYVNGQPASAFLLLAFGLQQGQVTEAYYDRFLRENSAQVLLHLSYTDRTFSALEAGTVSREANLVTSARGPLAVQAGGVLAYPNPAAGGALTVALGNGQQLPVQLTVRELSGRRVRTAPATTGQPSEVLRGLPAGLYVLDVQEQRSGTRASLKVTVQ